MPKMDCVDFFNRKSKRIKHIRENEIDLKHTRNRAELEIDYFERNINESSTPMWEVLNKRKFKK
jgi:hypothetical protein